VKVILFCGGQGLRLRDHSGSIPKPMVEIGGRPILWNIMNYYAHFGHREFVLCLGYGAETIRDYFEQRRHTDCQPGDSDDWQISYVDTGVETSIGQRLLAAGPHTGNDDIILANYGDVLTNAPLPELLERFRQSGKMVAFIAVRPRAYTFHLVRLNAEEHVQRVEEVSTADLWINGGYFMLRRQLLDEIGQFDDLVPDVLPRLIKRDEVLGYRYEGFWMPMDTVRDWQNLEGLVASGSPPWAVWQDRPTATLTGDRE